MKIQDVNYTPLLTPIGFLAKLKKFLTTFTVTSDANWGIFASVNNWDIESANFDDIPPSLRGMSKPLIENGTIVASIDNITQRLFTCYVDLPYLIICVQLPKTFPHVVLNGIKNEGGAQFLFKNSKRVSLEGTFDHYFRLYIDKNENIDALSIVTPDIMACIIDKNLKQDLEINGDKLYFIVPMSSLNAKFVQSALETAQPPINEIMHRAKTLDYTQQTNLKDAGADYASRIPKVILTPTRQTKILLVILGIFIVLIAIFMIIAARNFKS